MFTFNTQPPRIGWPSPLQLVLCFALLVGPSSVLAGGGNGGGDEGGDENTGQRLRKSKSVPLSSRPRGRRSSDNTGEKSVPRKKRRRRMTIDGRHVPARAIPSDSSPSEHLRRWEIDPALLSQLWTKQKEEMKKLWKDF